MSYADSAYTGERCEKVFAEKKVAFKPKGIEGGTLICELPICGSNNSTNEGGSRTRPDSN